MTDVERGSLPAWGVPAGRPDGVLRLLPLLPDLLLQGVLDLLDVGVLVCDADGRLTTWNDAALAWHATPLDADVSPAEWGAHFGLYEADGAVPLPADRLPLARTLREGSLADAEMTIAPPGLPSRLVTCDGRLLHDPAGRVAGAVVLLTDVTAGRAAQRQLRAASEALARTAQALSVSEERFVAVFHHGPMAMCALDAAGGISRVNPALRRLLATSSDRLLGERLESLVASADRNRFAVALAASGSPQLPAEPIEVRLQRPDGEQLWCEVGTTLVGDGAVHLLVSLADVDGRKHREAQLVRRAASDAVTGLIHRTALTVVLGELLAPQGDTGPLTLLHVDVDGPDAPYADGVVVEVAGRLRGAVRPQDLVARLAGGRFVVVCQDLDGPVTYGSRALVRRLHRVLSAPMHLPEGPARLTARIAVTQAVPGDDPAALLARVDAGAAARRSDVPLRPTATRSPPALSPPPPPPPTSPSQSPARLAELVDTAVAEDRLRIRYQPVVDLRNGVIKGTEALLRMTDRAGQVVLPDAFIPLAEASGAIHAMGEWVLVHSCRRVALWKARLPADTEFALGVNLSPRQLDDPHLLERVELALAASGLEPSALVLELTERLLTTGTAHVRTQLEGVRRLGVHLAADDFGTGYCSVRYLLDLPLDVIKIDRSWTIRFGEDSPTGRLADGVVQLARATGLVTIAEGVETERDRDSALARGLVLAQGYLFAEPLTARAFEDHLFAG